MRTGDLIYDFDTKVSASSDCDLISQQETTLINKSEKELSEI